MTKSVTLYIRIFRPITAALHEAFTHALVSLDETKEAPERIAHALQAKQLYGRARANLMLWEQSLGREKLWQLLNTRCEKELNSVNIVLEQLKDT